MDEAVEVVGEILEDPGQLPEVTEDQKFYAPDSSSDEELEVPLHILAKGILTTTIWKWLVAVKPPYPYPLSNSAFSILYEKGGSLGR